MAGERIAMDSAVVDAHAGNVEQVAADVRVAIQAAGQTMLSAGAFGLMCSWMIPPFLATTGLATSTLVSTASALDRSARELRGVASDFDAFEDETGVGFTRLRSGVEAL